jgi:16S rRNA U516 pseudouridylate synthase RsuA-like enzyme
MESRKLLLESTFAIKEEFNNNEATSWAVEELKCRGLKRLFKPVAFPAYELVREFYTHLRIDSDQPDKLFSSIDEEKWR